MIKRREFPHWDSGGKHDGILRRRERDHKKLFAVLLLATAGQLAGWAGLQVSHPGRLGSLPAGDPVRLFGPHLLRLLLPLGKLLQRGGFHRPSSVLGFLAMSITSHSCLNCFSKKLFNYSTEESPWAFSRYLWRREWEWAGTWLGAAPPSEPPPAQPGQWSGQCSAGQQLPHLVAQASRLLYLRHRVSQKGTLENRVRFKQFAQCSGCSAYIGLLCSLQRSGAVCSSAATFCRAACSLCPDPHYTFFSPTPTSD